MPKSKRIFNKRNSQKFLLITEGRDEDGEKITQNCLIPVSHKHAPGHSLLISQLSGVCGPPIAEKQKDKNKTEDSPTSKVKKPSELTVEEADLNEILDQFNESDEDWTSEEDDDEDLNRKFKKVALQEGPSSLLHTSSNAHVEILEEGSDFSDDFGEYGQFSDAESGDEEVSEFLNNMLRKNGLTSSKADCPENIKLLNEGFEKVLSEYKDDQIGALDDEEICGGFSAEHEQLQNFINTPYESREDRFEIDPCDDELKRKTLQLAEDAKPAPVVEIVTEKPLEWDCESILSTYSNIYNHPTVIKEEPKIRKITIPRNPLQKKLTRSQLRQLDSESESSDDEDDVEKLSVATSCNIRLKDETPEQRKERKCHFKEAKRFLKLS